jgi:hypothetical protein
MRSQGTVYSWCGCRDGKMGRRLGCRCPRRGEPEHGATHYRVRAFRLTSIHPHALAGGGYDPRTLLAALAP